MVPSVNPTRALKRICDLAREGAWDLSPHAEERALEREVTREDVYQVLTRALACYATPRGRWRLEGADVRGERLTAVVEIRGLALVVTVFRGDE
jgi:hypothetical protein